MYVDKKTSDTGGEKKRWRYRGDKIRTAGHHHSFPDLDPTATGTGNLKVHAGIEIRR